MELEQWHWIAGIVVAAVAVIGLFIKSKSSNTANNNQNSDVNGQGNSVSQNSTINQNGDN